MITLFSSPHHLDMLHMHNRYFVIFSSYVIMPMVDDQT